MFYIMQYLFILKRFPIRGFFLTISSVALVLSLGQEKLLNQEFLKLVPENKSGDYFYALLDQKAPLAKIQKELRMMPGIFRIETMSNDSIKKEVDAIIRPLTGSNVVSSSDFSYVGMQVIFIKDLSAKGQELVRDYFYHIAGGEEFGLIMGAIKTGNIIIKGDEDRAHVLQMIKSWGFSAIILLVFIFWCIAVWALQSKIRETAYLLERYQRKNFLSLKITSMGMMLIFILSSLFTFLLGLPDFKLLLVGLALFSLPLIIQAQGKKFEWEN